MRPARRENIDPTIKQTTAASAQVRTVLLVVICFLLGVGVGAFWYYRAIHHNPVNVGKTNGTLSESTGLVLQSLSSPVEIRFYSLLDPATTSEALRDFAGRVDQLLSEYEQEGGGKIKVTRQTTRSDSAAQAASADGVKAFNLDKGDACFLGIAVACNNRLETLGQLSPEWETALESDLSRAIAHVAAAKPVAGSAAASAAPVSAAVIAEVKRAIPNLDSVSLEEGTQTLRAAALKEIVEATAVMQQRVKEAEQRVSQALTNGNQAEQQAAVKQLQQVQAEQTEKLKEISARLQNQIAALQKLKKE